MTLSLGWHGASGTEINRGGACSGVAFANGVNSSGKLPFLHCVDNNSLKPFFKFCYESLITKLEENQLDMMNVTSQLVTAGG